MAVPVECEQCEARYLIDDKFAGKRAKCKRCGFVMSIPLPGGGSGGVAAHGATTTTVADGDDDVAPAAPPAPAVPGAPAGWRPEDVVIERDEDVTDIPLRGTGGGGSASGVTPFGTLVPALVIVFVVTVLALAVKAQVDVMNESTARAARSAGSVRVWAEAVMRLVTFFGVVGPLAMAGFIAAARIREFRLLSPAYLRATAIAALPLTLYLILSALSAGGLTNQFVFFLLILAVGGLTFWAIRVIFFLEPLPAAVAGVCGLVGGMVGFGVAVWLTATFISFVPERETPASRRIAKSDASKTTKTTTTDEPPAPGPGDVDPDPSAQTQPDEVVPGDGDPGAMPDETAAGTDSAANVAASGPPPGVRPPPGVGPPPGVRPPPGVAPAPPPGVAPRSPTERAPTTKPAAPATTRPGAPKRVTLFGEDDPVGGDAPGGAGEAVKAIVARITESAGPVARKVTGMALPPGAGPVLGTLAPSRTFAVVTRRTLNEEAVDLFTGEPLKRAATAVFKAGPQFAGNYAIHPDASRIIRVAAFPKLAARVWSVAEERELLAMELNGAFGVPHLVGFLGDSGDRFLVRWEKGGQHGLEVWDAKAGKSRRQVSLPDHEATPANEAVSPDGAWFAHCVRFQGKNQLLLHNLNQAGQPRRLPITALGEQWSIKPAGIAFSPDGNRVAALFVHEGDAVVAAYTVPAGKPAGEVIVPATVSALLSLDDDPVRSLDWVAGGKAWLICGTVIVDATGSGALLADLDAGGVVAQSAGEGNLVRLAFTDRDKPGALVTLELDPAKLRPPARPAGK